MVIDLKGKPASLGYRMPAEWEPHEQCWIGWPERPDNWREDAYYGQRLYADVASAISKFEPVTLCVSASQYTKAVDLLKDKPNVRIVEMSMNDSWFRDIGPTFVLSDSKSHSELPKYQVAGIDWNFNCWGGMG